MNISAKWLIQGSLVFTSCSATCSPFCDALIEVTKHLQTDFKAIRGAELEDDIYAAKVKLPNAKECEIDAGSLRADYSCEWQVLPETSSRAEALLAEIVSATNTCIAPRSLVLNQAPPLPKWEFKASYATLMVYRLDNHTVTMAIVKSKP